MQYSREMRTTQGNFYAASQLPKSTGRPFCCTSIISRHIFVDFKFKLGNLDRVITDRQTDGSIFLDKY